MNRPARLRQELRPHGVLAPGCPSCVWFDRCGGFEPERSLFNADCFTATCCKFTGDVAEIEWCDLACPHNPRFMELVADIGGLDTDHLSPLVQDRINLPLYVPLIHHAYSRREPLVFPAVALDTHQVLKLKGSRLQAVVEDAAALRGAFGLASGTTVLLRGVGTDRCLERYWEYRRHDAAPAQLARLGLSLAVGPNFSHFLNVPGTERMSNRKRQLLCLEEMMRAGLNPVPHLNAVQPGDWQFWRECLTKNATIRVVAVEFETGNKSPAEGRKVIDHLSDLQHTLGRGLHPLVIGGTQFVECVATRFDAATFIDSTPFVKALHRQGFDPSAGNSPWRGCPTAVGQPVDTILVRNLTRYAAWVAQRWAGSFSEQHTSTRSGGRRVTVPMCQV